MAEPGGTSSTPVSDLPYEKWPLAQKIGVLLPRTGNEKRDAAGRLETGYRGSGFFGGVSTDDIIEQESLLASEDMRFRSRNEDSLDRVKNVYETPSEDELRRRWQWGEPSTKFDNWGTNDVARTMARGLARNWALVDLGMDPAYMDENKSIKRGSLLGGLYQGSSDRMDINRFDKSINDAKAKGEEVPKEAEDWAVAQTAATMVHESIHRSIRRLVPGLKEKGIELSKPEEEALLHWFDRKYGPPSPDLFGKPSKSLPHIEDDYRRLIRKYNPEVLLRTLNTLAEEHIAKNANPRGPR